MREGLPSRGVCLTYDDWFADEWFSARDVFRAHGALATFFVAKAGTLSSAEIEKLLLLQEDGHEIGFHGTNHSKAASYLLTGPMDQYIADEIDTGLTLMRDYGFSVRSFAYPHHEYVTAMDPLLLERFDILRYRWDGPLLQERTYSLAQNSIVNVIGSLDITGTAASPAFCDALLDCIELNDRYGVFCGHSIGSTGPKGTHFCSLQDLDGFLNKAAGKGFGFATAADLAAKPSR
jgi:peptidoglycan/xylan/chitin deacetylase (PgdA/CDA1 family)